MPPGALGAPAGLGVNVPAGLGLADGVAVGPTGMSGVRAAGPDGAQTAVTGAGRPAAGDGAGLGAGEEPAGQPTTPGDGAAAAIGAVPWVAPAVALVTPDALTLQPATSSGSAIPATTAAVRRRPRLNLTDP